MYVIYGHIYELNLLLPQLNILSLQTTVLSPWWTALIPGGFYSVDVFFFLSAFLTFNLLTEKLYNKPIILGHYAMIYVH
jgi:hypothetical protein